jgi:hypothetical protein
VTRSLKLPHPPAALFEEDLEGAFARAEEVEEFLRRELVEPAGYFHSPTHEPLEDAYIGCLWSTAQVKVRGLVPVGTAEMPSRSIGRMNGHAKEIWRWQMRKWFGPQLPDFLITLNASYLVECDDYEVEFLATGKHELLHCRQETLDGKPDGPPHFRRDGSRVWTIWPHDAETFAEVAEDFGPVERGVAEIAEALKRPPRFSAAHIRITCGTLARAA